MTTSTAPTASTEEAHSIQERAEHLLEVADVVHQSHDRRKEKLQVLMSASADSFSSISGTDTLDINDSTQSTGSERELTVHREHQQTGSSSSPKDMHMDQIASTEKKKSRFQTVSELKQHILDCNRALTTMQENADLKCRKLELQVVDLRSTLESVRAGLGSANTYTQRLEKEKQMLEENLQKAVGKDQAEWLKKTKLKSEDLEQNLAQVTLERDDAEKDNEIMKRAMDDCDQCVKKIPDRQPSLRNINCNETETTGSSFWNTFTVAFKGLTAETEATPVSVSPPERQRPVYAATKQPPREMFLFKEQSNQIKEDLEADIEAMERQMQEDVDALKSEWSKPLPKVSGRGRRKYHDRKKHHRSKNTSIAGIATLDSFFASASEGLSLESEEMDEERSLFNISRSVTTAPVDRKRRKKKSQHRHDHSKPSSGDDDRRGSYMPTGKSASFRNNFRASLLGLGDEEVSAASGSNQSNGHQGNGYSLEGMNGGDDRVNDLQREVAEWGGAAKDAVVML